MDQKPVFEEENGIRVGAASGSEAGACGFLVDEGLDLAADRAAVELGQAVEPIAGAGGDIVADLDAVRGGFSFCPVTRVGGIQGVGGGWHCGYLP